MNYFNYYKVALVLMVFPLCLISCAKLDNFESCKKEVSGETYEGFYSIASENQTIKFHHDGYYTQIFKSFIKNDPSYTHDIVLNKEKEQNIVATWKLIKFNNINLRKNGNYASNFKMKYLPFKHDAPFLVVFSYDKKIWEIFEIDQSKLTRISGMVYDKNGNEVKSEVIDDSCELILFDPYLSDVYSK